MHIIDHTQGGSGKTNFPTVRYAFWLCFGLCWKGILFYFSKSLNSR